jgi:hypothetical protein
VVPFLCAVPALFHELAHSTLLHTMAPGSVDLTLGASELLPAVAILPFLLYQLAGFGTLHYVVPKAVNWIVNLVILCLIMGSYYFYREGIYRLERRISGLLVLIMAATVIYGVLKLKKMQADYDLYCPPKAPK